MSEAEVEEQIEEVADALSAARALLRVEVSRSCSFHAALRDVRIQESRSTGDHFNTSHHQIPSGSSSVGQPRIQTPQDLRALGQGTFSLEESPQEPRQTRETQVVLSHTRSHLQTPHPALSPTVQAASDQALDVTGSTGGQQSTLHGGDDGLPSDRHRSATPTPRDSRNTAATLDTPSGDLRGGGAGSLRRGKQRSVEPYSDDETDLDEGNGRDIPTKPRTPSPRNPHSGSGGPSRHGKERMLEPVSNEETGGDGGDIPMGGSPSPSPHQQRYGEVRYITITTFSHLHPPIEPTCNRGRYSKALPVIPQSHPRIHQRSYCRVTEEQRAER